MAIDLIPDQNNLHTTGIAFKDFEIEIHPPSTFHQLSGGHPQVHLFPHLDSVTSVRPNKR